jgi:DNA invertase Pin-like site-specific DNA recombinase/cell division protein FtsL
MKRVYCLYRVSTKAQLAKPQNDFNLEEDIPLQKQACHAFADHNKWPIVKEFYEKGISGFKVKATKRDAIQDLKAAAEKGEFDILLVFMFDRIGRIDDETPFVVEWFVNHGIEVWSVKEGEQRFDNHVDKLTNYIRFWQANGESRKTSARVKTRLNQLTAEGTYTGGVTPFGYKTIPSGRLNKRGKELLDLVIDQSEAPIVRMIFEKTVREGYGSFRMAEYLNQMGIKTHNGSAFQCNTVNRILHNRLFCGYYVSGDTVSPQVPALQIIDEELFAQAQKILNQRSDKSEQKQQIARNTKGQTLLSGNLYCAHCGSHLIATSYVDSHIRADGSKYEVRKQRYICCNKARHRGVCAGQSAYVSARIDEAVAQIVREYLSRIQTTPKSIALEKRYQTEIAGPKVQRRETEQVHKQWKDRLVQLTAEIAKALLGDSAFTPDMLSMAIDNAKTELQKTEDKLAELNFGLNNQQGAMKKLDFYYDQFQSWAAEFDSATLEQRKMILCQLVREIRVARGYELEVVLDLAYGQFLVA